MRFSERFKIMWDKAPRRDRSLVALQTAAVYRWEAREARVQERLTVLQCLNLADEACTGLGIPQTDGVVMVEGQTRPTVNLTTRVIKLPSWALQAPIVLHEVAHLKALFTMHEPAWVNVYIGLLVKHAGMAEQHLRKTARWYGVRM